MIRRHTYGKRRLITCGLFLICTIARLSIDSHGQQEPENKRRSVKFGTVSYLTNLWYSEITPSAKPTAQDRTNYLDAVRDLGVTGLRDTIMNWTEIEPVRGGAYQFDAYDDFVRKASDRGIELIALAYPVPPWAAADSNDLLTGLILEGDPRGKPPLRKYEPEFKKFVRAVVGRYCGCANESLQVKMPIKHWLFMNEAGLPATKDWTPDELAHWLKIFYEEVKAVDPSAKIMAAGFLSPGVQFPPTPNLQASYLEQFFRSKELQGPKYPYFDILSFHIYPVMYAPSPNIYALNVTLGYIHAAMKKNKVETPVWLTEMGDNSPDRIVQADRIVEFVAHAVSLNIERVHVFGLWDFSVRVPGRMVKANWGLLEDTPSGEVPVRKASYIAYQTLLKKIKENQGGEFLGPGRYIIYKPSGKPIYILRAEGSSAEIPAGVKGRIRVTSLQNQEQIIDAKDLRLTSHPVIVESVE